MIALEIKTTEIRHTILKNYHYFPYVLKHYDELQMKVYSALFSCRVPIYYCYAIHPFPQARWKAIKVLEENYASEPDCLLDTKRVVRHREHTSLISVIDGLKKNEIGSTGVATAMMYRSLATTNPEPGLRFMLLAYNLEDGRLEIYGSRFVQEFEERMKSAVGRDISKTCILYKGKSELISDFRAYINEFRNELLARQIGVSTGGDKSR